MKQLYFKLAWTNIKNGKQFYLPYLLTGILTVAMFYSMVAIQQNQGLTKVPGADSLKTILVLGTIVIAIFTFVFLFYTNSFIMKRRKQELGIYNILGMEKRHIGKVLLVETFITAVVSIGGGIIIGIVFNKLLMMILYRMIAFDTVIQFYISQSAIVQCGIFFGVIYFVTLCYDILQVKLAKPVELLSGGNVGEREPKTKGIMALIGLLSLGAGYYISFVTKSPLQALSLFFVAVLLVILGTYFLFTSGSIVILKVLRKNKKFYYKTRHFTAVSGMIYRMKQNAVGLANICILSTMVLVMVSTTVSMFVGVDDELKTRFGREINVTAMYQEPVDNQAMVDVIHQSIADQNRKITKEEGYEYLSLSGIAKKDEVQFDSNDAKNIDYSDLTMLTCMDKKEYEKVKGKSLPKIQGDEVILIGQPEYSEKTIRLFQKTYQVKQYQNDAGNSDSQMSSIAGGTYYVLLPNQEALESLHQMQAENLGEKASAYQYKLSLDIDGTRQEKKACDQAVERELEKFKETGKADDYLSIYGEYMQTSRGDFYSIYGGFFFLGLFLGSMFLMVTVLIIFYKQISEGYEDKERFAIMEKVGMSNREVKETINSQVRMVFFLPILMATIHVIAAFPLIKRLLIILNLTNSTLFAWCMAGTVLVFCIIYFVVFYMTSKAYYKIVGNQIR